MLNFQRAAFGLPAFLFCGNDGRLYETTVSRSTPACIIPTLPTHRQGGEPRISRLFTGSRHRGIAAKISFERSTTTVPPQANGILATAFKELSANERRTYLGYAAAAIIAALSVESSRLGK